MRTWSTPMSVLGSVLLLVALLTLTGAAVATAADETPPRTRHLLDPAEPDGGGSWYRSGVTVTLHADDDSGTATIEYRVDDGEWQSSYFGLQNHGDADLIEYRDIRVVDLGPVTSSVTVAGSDGHTIEFRATDVAGNREPLRSLTFTID